MNQDKQNILPEVMNYLDYREFLKDWLETKKKTSKAFSHRHIASKIGLKSGGHISQILNGKASLSGAHLDAFIELLNLAHHNASYFKHLVYLNQAKTQEEQKSNYEKLQGLKGASVVQLDKDQFEYYSHWSYSAIREALTVFQIKDDPQEFSFLGRQLIPPLSHDEIQQGIELLKRLELIQANEEGFLKASDQILTTGKQVQGLYLNEYVQEVLKLAQGAVQRIPVGEKYNSWISMAIGKQAYPKVIEELRQSRQRILKLVEEDPEPTRVYHLNLNLFPFTHRLNK